MSKPTGYIVRPRDMKRLEHTLNRTWAVGDIYDAARTLIGFAEPQQTQQTQLPPVSVASLALPLDNRASWEAHGCGHIVPIGTPHVCVGLTALPLDEPVNAPADPDVEPQPYDMPSPEADALVMRAYVDADTAQAERLRGELDRIAELVEQAHADSTDTRVTWGAYVALADYVTEVLRETGRLA